MKTIAVSRTWKTSTIVVISLILSLNTLLAKNLIPEEGNKNKKKENKKEVKNNLDKMSKTAVLKEISENEIKVEEWMLTASPEFWKITKDSSDTEDELEIEEWMLNPLSW